MKRDRIVYERLERKFASQKKKIVIVSIGIGKSQDNIFVGSNNYSKFIQ